MFTKPTRNHFTYVIERLGMPVAMVLFALYTLATNASWEEIFTVDYWEELWYTLQDAGDLTATAGALFMAAFLVMLIVILLRWRKTFFYIEGEQFVYERRTLFHKKTVLPLQEIATVNLERNVAERILGTAKVKLDLNAAQTADRTDFVLILKLATAQSLCDTLNQTASLATAPTQEKPRTQIAYFSFGQAVKHKLLSAPLIQVMIVLGVLVTPLQQAAQESKSALLIALGVGILGVVGYLLMGSLNYSDYTVETDTERFYISYGKIRKNSFSFHKDNINAVTVRRPLLARPLHLCSVEVTVVGLGDQRTEIPQLCLLCKETQAAEILETYVPAFHRAGERHSANKGGLWGGLLVWGIVTAVMTTVLVCLTAEGAWYSLLAVPALGMAHTLCAHFAKGLWLGGETLTYQKGVFSPMQTTVLCRDIQHVDCKASPIMAKTKGGNLGFSILAAHGMRTQRPGCYDKALFQQAKKTVYEAKDRAKSAVASSTYVQNVQ